MDNNKAGSSLFDKFLDEISNEYDCDTSVDGKSIGLMCTSDEINPISEQQDADLDNNCDFMLKAFDDAFETIYGDNEISFIQVKQISEELQTNCIRLINKFKSQKDSTEIEQLRSKHCRLENESRTIINKLQCQVAELNLQLERQSKFSSMIGYIFGNYLWKATQIPDVVHMVLQKNKISKMVNLITTILSSFIETYNNNMPSIQTNETKFVLNILGIIANLTTTQAGCHFFSQVNDGIKVVDLIISLVVFIPSSLENNLKKIAYAVLYNVSIQFNGHLLMEKNKLIQTLHNDIKTLPDKGINETLIFALKLLHSLTRNINKSMYSILKDEINLEEILKLTRFTETELISRKIYENINTATEKYNKFQ